MSVAGSMSSAGQGGSKASAAAGLQRGGGGEGLEGETDMLEQNHTILTGIFGTLYTLSKEKVDQAPKWAVARIVLDFLQLFILILRPAYGWKIEEDLWLWKLITYIDWKNPVVSRGYGFYIAVLYIIASVLGISLALCAYVAWAFKTSNFTLVWPLKVLRFYVSVFFQFFFIASLSVFLVALDCRLFGFSGEAKGTLALFPDVECLAMPHLIHASVALTCSLLFLAVSFLITLADFEIDPLSQRLLAAAHSRVEVRAWALKSIMVIITVILGAYPKWQAGIILLMTWLMVWSYIRLAPHLNHWVNHVRCGLYAAICWEALILAVLVLTSNKSERFQGALTVAMLSGLAPMMCLGFGLSWLRRRLTYCVAVHKFRMAPPGTRPKKIYRFWDVTEVEICSRVMRTWDRDADDPVPEERAVELAETIIKAGMSMFPLNPQMTLLYSSFLMDVQGSYQSGYSQLQTAKKASPSWTEKFIIFVREQEHLQKASQGKSGDATVDLISYVEFQRSHRMVLRAHKASMYAIRDFWRHLLHSEVSFRSLSRCLGRIETSKAHAEKLYRNIVQRYPNSPKLLRSYARYLEGVKNDPWAAVRYYTEADKVEEAEEAETGNNGFTDDGAEGGGAAGFSQKNNAVIVINAQGIMQMANKLAHEMFGYKKGEMEAKNISMLCPPPFAQRHNSYLAKYVATGQVHILDMVREVLGMHKDKFCFPISLYVSKISGTGVDSMFMGVLKKMELDPSIVRAYAMPSGQIAAMDSRYTDWFARHPSELIGKPVQQLAVESDVMTKLVSDGAMASEVQLTKGAVYANNVHLIHKYFQPVSTNIVIRLGGTEGQRIVVFEIKRNQPEDSFLVCDAKGKIRFITSGLLLMLGYDEKAVASGALNMNTLIPQPFSQLHPVWLREMSGTIPLGSCRAGTVVAVSTANKVLIPVQLSVTSCEEHDETLYVTKFRKATIEEGNHDKSLQLQIDVHGNVLSVSDTPQALFGIKPAALVGRNVSEFVDVMRPPSSAEQSSEAATEQLLSTLINRSLERPGYNWRVGVSPPMSEAERSALGTMASALLAKQTKAAVMMLSVTEDEEQGMSLTLGLWRADLIMGVVEVDKHGQVQRPNEYPLQMAGLIFGIPETNMTRQAISKYLHMSGASVDSLLSKDSAKKGAMKSHTVTATKVGPVKKMSAQHADRQELTVTVQAVTKDGPGKRLLLLLKIKDAKKGSPGLFARMVMGQDDPSKSIAGSVATAIEPLPGSKVREAPKLEHKHALDRANSEGSMKKGGVKFAAVLSETGVHDEADSLDELSRSQLDIDDKELQLDREPQDEEEPDKPGDTEDPAEQQAEQQGPPSAPDEQAMQVEHRASPRPMPPKLDRTAHWVQSEGTHAPLPDFDDNEEERAQVVKKLSGPLASAPPPNNEDAASERSGGSQGHSEGQASSSQPGDGGESEAGTDVPQTDYRRGKRYKKLVKLLSSSQAQGKARAFNTQSLVAVGLLLFAHMVCFILMVVLLDKQITSIIDMDLSGDANLNIQNTVVMSRAYSNIQLGLHNPNIYTPAQLPWVKDRLKESIDKFEELHHAVYLGKEKLRRLPDDGLRSSWDDHIINVTRFMDITPAVTGWDMSNLWTLGNDFVSDARNVHHNGDLWVSQGMNIRDHRSFKFLFTNGNTQLFDRYKATLDALVNEALSATEAVNSLQIALLIIEGLVFSTAIMLYMLFRLRSMSNQRYSLYSVFFIIPQGFTRALATKQVIIEDDSDAGSESDAADVPAENKQQQQNNDANSNAAGAGAAPTGLKLALNHVNVSGVGGSFKEQVLGLLMFWKPKKPAAANTGGSGSRRNLVKNSRESWLLLLPFAFWSCLMIVIYAVGYSSLAGAADPVSTLNIVNFVKFRTQRVIAFAQRMVCVEDPADLPATRESLASRLQWLEEEYEVMMYGAHGRTDPHFSKVKTGVAFSSQIIANMMFNTKTCLRKDQSTCFPPEHEFYEVANSGLDAIIRRMFEEAHLLVEDSPQNLTIFNHRLEYLWQVGVFDAYDGLDRLNDEYLGNVIGLYSSVRAIHIIVFVISWFLGLAFILLVLRPFARRVSTESRQVAELLSQLPPDLDVEGVLTRTLAGKKTSEDVEDPSAAAGNLTRTASEAAKFKFKPVQQPLQRATSQSSMISF